MHYEEHKKFMQLSENTRFLLLTLGVFCLTLGGAVALFALLERLFFELRFGKPFIIGCALALLLGGLLLRFGRQRLT
ncbi:MAG: hypothetical protein HY011_23560 [Acidobacteria bacterium]|nr:hypothetical protein [Acidobacteriota bacterium]